MEGDWGVEARVVKGRFSEQTVRKFFKTEKARDKWLEKQEETGKLIEVLAWSFPETPGLGWSDPVSRALGK